MKLFEAGGFSMLTLTTKKVSGKFVPVGEEEYGAVIISDDGYVVVVVDEDGYTKAQSKAAEQDEATDTYKKLLQNGTEQFSGDKVTMWARKYPVVDI